MIITNNRRQQVLPEPGDVFKTVIGQGPDSKLILVSAERAEDPDDCTGCIFEALCQGSNKTHFVCYGPDRYDGVSIKIVPFVQESE